MDCKGLLPCTFITWPMFLGPNIESRPIRLMLAPNQNDRTLGAHCSRGVGRGGRGGGGGSYSFPLCVGVEIIYTL